MLMLIRGNYLNYEEMQILINQIKDIEAIVIDDDNKLYTSQNIKLSL